MLLVCAELHWHLATDHQGCWNPSPNSVLDEYKHRKAYALAMDKYTGDSKLGFYTEMVEDESEHIRGLGIGFPY